MNESINELGFLNSNSGVCLDLGPNKYDHDEILLLRKKLNESQNQCNIYKEENEKLNKELFDERVRMGKMRTKLQFVKENQDVFQRLKDAYINMKYNESMGNKMVEIRERSVQTYEGILCRACIETEQVRRKIDGVMDKFKNSMLITSEDMDKLTTTTLYLTDLLERRERSWTKQVQKEDLYKRHIIKIEKENGDLRDLLKRNAQRHSSGNNSVAETQTEFDFDEKYLNEINSLKAIILKLETRKITDKQSIGDNNYLEGADSNVAEDIFNKYGYLKHGNLQRKPTNINETKHILNGSCLMGNFKEEEHKAIANMDILFE